MKFPELVIGDPVMVNSLEPASANPTDVTVPVLLGVTLVKVISVEPMLPELSVVHRKIRSAPTVPSCTMTN